MGHKRKRRCRVNIHCHYHMMMPAMGMHMGMERGAYGWEEMDDWEDMMQRPGMEEYEDGMDMRYDEQPRARSPYRNVCPGEMRRC